MANTTYTKYPIKWLNDTYYEVSRTSSFWSSNVKTNHSFYVKGYHHGIGAYSQGEFLYWTNFVEFLNQNLFGTESSYIENFKHPSVQWFLKLIDGYTFKDISTSIMCFSFRDCSTGAYKQIDGVSKVESVTIMPNHRASTDVLSPMSVQCHSVIDAVVYVNGNKYREIPGDDFRAIIKIVHLAFLSYLPKMIFNGFFTFHNDPLIIEVGKQNKWLY